MYIGRNYEHGNSKVKPRFIKAVTRFALLEHKGNIAALSKASLFERFVGNKDKPGKFFGVVSRTAFYELLADKRYFKYPRLTTVPFLKANHIAARLAFANDTLKTYDTKDKMCAFLNRTIFVDGTMFGDKYEEGYGLEDQRYIAPAKNGPIRTKTQYPVLKPNNQLYQGITVGDRTAPFIVNTLHPEGRSTINTDMYISFLTNYVGPLSVRMRARLHLRQHAPIYLVFDHAACHLSGRTKAVMAELHLESARLPARCPELNVIELLWGFYKRKLRACKKQDDLRALIIKIAEEYPMDQITNLMNSFGCRLKEMVKAKGGKFKYKGSTK